MVIIKGGIYSVSVPKEVLIHKGCGGYVKKGFAGIYACPKCNSWVHHTMCEWKKEHIT